MRLSRPRVWLRVALLVTGGAFMLWRAHEARAGRTLPGSEGELAARVALVWALAGLLALVTAAGAALSLLPRPRRKTLRLRDGDRHR